MKICHVITGLDTGGAEMMLSKLVAVIDSSRFATEVISLTDIGPIGRKIAACGIPVRSLGMRRGVPSPSAVVRLARWLRQTRPDIVHTWMYHADAIGGMAARLAGGVPVAWCVRNSTLSRATCKRSTLLTVKACASLSRRLPQRIICCSEVAQRVHVEMGYARERMLVIPNGFDLRAFLPDPAARRDFRLELGVSESTPLIGLVARWDPQKDHKNFVRAAALLRKRHPDARFVLCGDNITGENRELTAWIEREALGDRCFLLGRRQDIPRINAALDIASSSSSYGEAFPNVLGEAMACGVPCVATDVGDSALIIDATGRVVPSRDPAALADAWGDLLDAGPDERARLGSEARQRVETHFNLPEIVLRYQDVYTELASSR